MVPGKKKTSASIEIKWPLNWSRKYFFLNKVNDKLTVVDGLVGELMDGLVERGLDTCANVIVVSDHGNSLQLLTISPLGS